jgi:hypothetical protein
VEATELALSRINAILLFAKKNERAGTANAQSSAIVYHVT